MTTSGRGLGSFGAGLALHQQVTWIQRNPWDPGRRHSYGGLVTGTWLDFFHVIYGIILLLGGDWNHGILTDFP